jgi:hypothetical protein
MLRARWASYVWPGGHPHQHPNIPDVPVLDRTRLREVTTGAARVDQQPDRHELDPARRSSRWPQLARLPDTQLPAAKPRTCPRGRLPDIQPPTPNASAGVGGTRVPTPSITSRVPNGTTRGSTETVSREVGLPKAGPLARVAGHLEAAKQGPASSGRAGRPTQGGRPIVAARQEVGLRRRRPPGAPQQRPRRPAPRSAPARPVSPSSPPALARPCLGSGAAARTCCSTSA